MDGQLEKKKKVTMGWEADWIGPKHFISLKYEKPKSKYKQLRTLENRQNFLKKILGLERLELRITLQQAMRPTR